VGVLRGSNGRLLTVTAVLVAAAASVAAVSAAPASRSTSLKGGTYRVGWEPGWNTPFDWSDGFDPTGERADFGIYSNLLVRTLVGYDHVAGAAGTRLVPDLAVSVPTPTNGGRRYTFTLKRGIRFGPPVNREITSGDIRYAIERLARPKNDPQTTLLDNTNVEQYDAPYAFYFKVIQGFDAYRRGRAKSIAGIVTPNAKTITFDLVRPAGDFLNRLALPAAGPIPAEVAKCFEGRPGAYGRDVISSGPYMIEGADTVKLGSCRKLTPMRGISDSQLTLVRNPRYDPRTDSTAARENNPDRFVFVVDTNTQRGKAVAIVKRLAAGELDDADLGASLKLIGKYAASASKRGLLRVNSPNLLFYLTMNLTRPPFDDVHVRRAMSWIMDKAALRDAAWGGALAGTIAKHIVPDELLDNRLKAFASFESPGDHGNLAKAKAEMAKSRYASKGGVCIAKACKRVRLVHVPLTPITYTAGQRMAPIIEANAARIGITFVNRGLRPDQPAHNQPITFPAYSYQAYPDASSFVDPLLAGGDILPSSNRNYSLVGITPAQAAGLGVKGRLKGVPSVDADIARCSALAGNGRIGCYAALDRKVSTEIVPWIPLVWRSRVNILGAQVSKWAFDQSTGMTGFAHVAVKG
jgi:ABC-type transport system substrate-binding protein